MRRLIYASAFAVALSLGPWACSGGNTSSSTPSTPTPTTAATPSVTAVTVTVVGGIPAIGSTAQFTATASLSNGTTQTVTTQATWQSSALGIVTITAAGVITAVAAGEADIIATYQTVSGTSHITIAGSAASAPTAFTLSGAVTDGTSGGALPGIAIAGANTSTTTDSTGR
jgi:hypothetical protein